MFWLHVHAPVLSFLSTRSSASLDAQLVRGSEDLVRGLSRDGRGSRVDGGGGVRDGAGRTHPLLGSEDRVLQRPLPLVRSVS